MMLQRHVGCSLQCTKYVRYNDRDQPISSTIAIVSTVSMQFEMEELFFLQFCEGRTPSLSYVSNNNYSIAFRVSCQCVIQRKGSYRRS